MKGIFHVITVSKLFNYAIKTQVSFKIRSALKESKRFELFKKM